jgi:hypothetical protein
MFNHFVYLFVMSVMLMTLWNEIIISIFVTFTPISFLHALAATLVSSAVLDMYQPVGRAYVD